MKIRRIDKYDFKPVVLELTFESLEDLEEIYKDLGGTQGQNMSKLYAAIENIIKERRNA